MPVLNLGKSAVSSPCGSVCEVKEKKFLGPAPSRDTNREARSKFSNLRSQYYHLIINGKY